MKTYMATLLDSIERLLAGVLLGTCPLGRRRTLRLIRHVSQLLVTTRADDDLLLVEVPGEARCSGGRRHIRRLLVGARVVVAVAAVVQVGDVARQGVGVGVVHLQVVVGVADDLDLVLTNATREPVKDAADVNALALKVAEDVQEGTVVLVGVITFKHKVDKVGMLLVTLEMNRIGGVVVIVLMVVWSRPLMMRVGWDKGWKLSMHWKASRIARGQHRGVVVFTCQIDVREPSPRAPTAAFTTGK